MIFHLLRAFFVLTMAAIGWFAIKQSALANIEGAWLLLAVAVTVSVLVISADILAPRGKLAILSGTFLGLLVGIILTYALSFVVLLLVDLIAPLLDFNAAARNALTQFFMLAVGAVCCYLSVSFILQTKDDFRFIIPYVEFSKQTKGARPIVLDTNVLIDGRIVEIVETGFIESQIVVPQFVIDELQLLADQGDKLKRLRGRRGLEIVQKLRANTKTDVLLYDSSGREPKDLTDVDHRLVQFAQELNARVLTNDTNLRDVAQLRGVSVINLNDLAVSLKPVVLPGEKMTVRLIKPGDSPGQGVGFLDDGTMVVVEQARARLNEEIEFTVTNHVQTKAGRIIFGRLGEQTARPAPNKQNA